MPLNISNSLRITGWMREAELLWLAETAAKSKIIIEVGCFAGRSTRTLADNTEGKVFCVDPYSGDYYQEDGSPRFHFGDAALETFKENLKDHLQSGKIAHHRGTLYTFPIIEADFIFIDGDHRYSYIVSDIQESLKRIKPGGIVSGHDYMNHEWPGVKRAVDEYFPKFQVVDTIWWATV